jgi:ribosomal protein S13
LQVKRMTADQFLDELKAKALEAAVKVFVKRISETIETMLAIEGRRYFMAGFYRGQRLERGLAVRYGQDSAILVHDSRGMRYKTATKPLTARQVFELLKRRGAL